MSTSYLSRLGSAPEEGAKAPVVAATTANITLSGEQTIDTVSVVAGNRVLVKDQIDTTENGIYDASTGAWTRSTDFNAANDVINGNIVVDANTAVIYQASFTGSFTPGTTALTFPFQNFGTHITNPTDAHDASAISNVPAGSIASTDVQSALNELDTDKTAIADLIDTATGKGASLVSIEDALGIYDSTTVEGALAEIQNGYTNKADAITHQPVNGVIRWIGGTDGGWFKEITGAAPGTYSDNAPGSPGYCGTQFIPTAGDGSAAWVRVDQTIITAAMFGEDLDLLFAASPKIAILSSNTTYNRTDTVDITSPCSVDLNGSTVSFSLTTQIPGMNLTSDDVEIFGGTINVVGTTMAGSGSSLNCITIGNQTTGAGYKNFHFHDLTVSTNRNDAGASIGVFGECSEGVIEDITVPDNANCRNVIGCEWGGDSGGTGHPHNIRISRINCGELTYAATTPLGFGYVVWASSAFNITIEDIRADKAFGLVAVVAGDNANVYAPARYKESVGKGITIDGAVCSEIFGYGTRIVGKGGAQPDILDMGVDIANLHVIGDTSVGHTVYGFSLEFCRDVSLRDFSLSSCDVGYVTGSDVKRNIIRDGKITDSLLYGAQLGSSGVKCIDPVMDNVTFLRNNASAGASTGTAALVLTKTRNPQVSNCTFGEEDVTETQKYSIACTDDTERPKLNNNHTESLAASGVSYVIGSSSNTLINASGTNNTSALGLTNASGAPIFQIDSNGGRECVLSAAPTVGTYKQGDTIRDITPSASSFIGWTCTASGTFSTATDATGDTDGSTAVITGMTDTSDFNAGEFVTVSAGFPSAVTPYQILSLTASSVTLDTNSTSIQANVTVATVDPVFKTFGAISA